MPSKELPWLSATPGHEVACIVPHQDDETVFAAVLSRYPNALVVYVTDGGPIRPIEWKGQPTREAYVAMRQQEANAALDAALHIGPPVALRVMDGTSAHQLEEITQKLYALLKQHHTSVVYCLAYEGGHPDHDATACAVHMAVKQVVWPIRVIEAPIYRMGPEQKLVWQRFVPFPGVEEVTLELTSEERDIKRKMILAHESQQGVLARLSESHEYYREAPAYDFSQPANDGQLSVYYGFHNIDASRWRQLVGPLLAQLHHNNEV